MWIKGHNEHAENERCDKLAKGAIKKCKKVIPPHPPFSHSGGFAGAKEKGGRGI